jgi:hypothetical protein
MAKPWRGALTVEQAAERVGWEPVRMVGYAALAGVPKGYGPFPTVDGSAWRIMIDEADLVLWRAAGCPDDAQYRDGGKG